MTPQLALAFALWAPVGAEAPLAPVARAAVVVGANHAPPGRKPLRFARQDARDTAQMLSSVGGFAKSEMAVLLDPTPDAVLDALDAALAELAQAKGESLLIFHYSGHADVDALYPGGTPLSLEALRTRLDHPAASVRVGIIDACRGGGWTGARGLNPVEPFVVSLPMSLSSEGSVLIASSSGLEDAHESEALRGGFFTHHWNAALRGAGDRNLDQTVTLTEAFEYAKALTIRDSAMRTGRPQHPSFKMALRGRSDLPLARVAMGTTTLEVTRAQGPLQLVDLGDGRVVAEMAEGTRTVRLSLPAGKYLLREEGEKGTRASTVEVLPDRTTVIRADQLEVVGKDAFAARTAQARPVNASTLQQGKVHLALGFGVRHTDIFADSGLGRIAESTSWGLLHVGLSDRWQWAGPVPAFAYRGGNSGDFEWVPWGGLASVGISVGDTGTTVSSDLGLGIDVKWWHGPRQGLVAGIGTRHRLDIDLEGSSELERPRLWEGFVAVGYTYTAGDIVTLHLGLRYQHHLFWDGGIPDGEFRQAAGVGLGSVQDLGIRPLPLVRVHLSDVFTLDGYAAVDFDLGTETFQETYLLGASATF